ncbi:protein sprint-like [Centruroides sculpturatus]|uniref:protein sprint-like n=1 Tax=Centruroides sculpturatus TaxID=218467 RepID=UPI000C6E90A7|nr:protein sprint-like [Centruroides sculpturatus]
MLQDLFPDASLLPLTDQYGYPTHFSPDDPFVCHTALFEQFMRGTADSGSRDAPHSESSGEYRTSQSLAGIGGASTSEVSDGRTTPSAASISPPSPPPRTTPLSIYSSQIQPGGGASEETGAETTTSVSSIQETSEEDSSRTSSSFAPCDIGLLERLIRTHPIWFLPGIGRAGAVHLLQGKEVGTFIVRQSSKPNTMALSVRLPENRGPYVEHYLIEAIGDGKLRLEGSDNHFHAIPMLVVHYYQCCDELPVQLTLPSPLAQAMSRQELSSLGLLGQDFWLSSLVQSPTVSFAGPTSAFLPVSSNHSLPSHSSAPHSSFRPVQGRSPTSSFTNSLMNSSQPQCSSSSGPPPPIPQAPKPPPRNVPPPPPPPPRSFIPMRSSGSATRMSSMDMHSVTVASNGTTSVIQEDTSTNKENATRVSPLHSVQHNTKSNLDTKSDPKIKQVAHYKQSNIVESKQSYYRSSLADKISDYEDIWGSPIPSDKDRKSDFTTFKSSETNSNSRQIHRPKRESAAIKLLQLKLQQMVNEETQTDLEDEDDYNDSNIQLYSSDKSDISEPCTSHGSKTGNVSWLKQGNNSDSIIDFPSEAQFTSPFYAEPVDSIKYPFENEFSHDRLLKDTNTTGRRLLNHRFSDPNIHWPPSSSGVGVLQRKDSPNTNLCPEENGISLSSSLENLKALRSTPLHRRHQSLSVSAHWLQQSQLGSPNENSKRDVETQVTPQEIQNNSKNDRTLLMSSSKSRELESTWAVDSSWEWLVNDDSSEDEHFPLDSRFPTDIKKKSDDNQSTDATTVEELISPDLRVPQTRLLTQSNLMRVSEYDNLGGKMESSPVHHQQQINEIMDDTATEFSEPWDSLRWERLLRLVISEKEINEDIALKEQQENNKNVFCETNSRNGKRDDAAIMAFEDSENASVISAISGSIDDTSISEYPTMTVDKERSKSFQERLEPLLAAQRVVALRNKNTRVGDNIRQYIFSVRGTKVLDSAVVDSESDSKELLESAAKQRHKWRKSEDFSFTVDIMKRYKAGQNLHILANPALNNQSSQLLCVLPKRDFETEVNTFLFQLRPNEFLNIDAITEGALHKLVIKPLKSFIYQLFVNEYTSTSSDDSSSQNFLPIFIYVLVQCGIIAAEIEADYMWGLLHPSLLSGEGGYYLTTLSSAVHVLKNFQTCNQDASQTHSPSFTSTTQMFDKSPKQSPLESRKPSIADLQGFMKIVIPDELTGSIISKTFPVRPNMTTKEVCKMIAHKFNITNPQDYCLFKLVKGEETQLGDNECPQTVKEELSVSGAECAFAYKRCDAKFVWPLLESS